MAHARSEQFAALIGTDFTLAEVGVVVKLRVADNVGTDALSLVFDGPPEPVLGQGSYTFERDGSDGELIFMTPISADESAVTYEAVFA